MQSRLRGNAAAESAQAQQALDAEIVTLVNSLGTQLSNDLGAPGQSAIEPDHGSVLVERRQLRVGCTLITGNLLATLMSVPADELDNWDFVPTWCFAPTRGSSSRSFT